MTTRELINHLEDLIREGKITGASEVVPKHIGENIYGWTLEKEDVYAGKTEELDGHNTQLILDIIW